MTGNIGLQLTVAMLLGLTHTLLIALLVPAGSRGRGIRIAILAGHWALQTAFRYFEQMEGWGAYLLMAALYGAELLCFRLRSGRPWAAVFQRCLCFFLITETCTLVFSHLSMKFLGADLLRSEPVGRMAIAFAVLLGVLYLLLRGVFSLFPAENGRISHTTALGFISAVPFLFVRHITFWVPVTAEEVPAAMMLTIVMACVVSVAMNVCLERLMFTMEEKRRAEQQRHMA